MKKHTDIIKNCPLFSGIEENELSSLLSCLGAKTKKAVRNEIIINEGDEATFIGLLLSGSAEISHGDCYGNKNIVATVFPSELFAEAFAAAGADRIPMTVTALSDSEYLAIPYNRVISPCSNACGFHSKLIANLLKITAGKNLLLTKKIEIISKRTTREKLLTYLSFEAEKRGRNEFDIPFDRQGLADYLGAERSALSAVISSLRHEGIIESHKNKFKIKEPSL
ncbi:MAG: Crp/Fnr family transcriptional regulator [Clostridia bacterium]|nr:Crp/Fnr family transcriptional regulator [Clostridia bacterium]